MVIGAGSAGYDDGHTCPSRRFCSLRAGRTPLRLTNMTNTEDVTARHGWRELDAKVGGGGRGIPAAAMDLARTL